MNLQLLRRRKPFWLTVAGIFGSQLLTPAVRPAHHPELTAGKSAGGLLREHLVQKRQRDWETRTARAQLKLSGAEQEQLRKVMEYSNDYLETVKLFHPDPKDTIGIHKVSAAISADSQIFSSRLTRVFAVQ